MALFGQLHLPWRSPKHNSTMGFHDKINCLLRHRKRMPLFYLPPEIILLIADHLPERGLISLRQCSRDLYELTTRAHYRNMTLRTFSNGLNGLASAAYCNLLSEVEVMVWAGANVDMPGTNGYTALHEAAARGHTEIVQVLLDAKSTISQRAECGTTPLHIAAQNGHLECVKLLAERGADTAARNLIGETPIDLAAESRSLATIDFLRERGPPIAYRHWNGGTSLHEASKLGLDMEVKRFLQGRSHGTLDSGDDAGSTPLHLAASFGHEEIVEMLLGAGADVMARDFDGRTPLHRASCQTPAVVKSLLARGASVDCRDAWDRTPMLSVCHRVGSPEIVMLFIKAGSDVNVSAAGMCLMASLDSDQDRDIIMLLEAAGCRCEEHGHDTDGQ